VWGAGARVGGGGGGAPPPPPPLGMAPCARRAYGVTRVSVGALP